MKSNVTSLTAGIFLLFAWVWAGPPAYAEDVNERITAVQKELEQLKAEQLEIKKGSDLAY